MRVHPLRDERLRLHEGDGRMHGQIPDGPARGPRRCEAHPSGKPGSRACRAWSFPLADVGRQEASKRHRYSARTVPYVICFTERGDCRRPSDLRRIRYRFVERVRPRKMPCARRASAPFRRRRGRRFRRPTDRASAAFWDSVGWTFQRRKPARPSATSRCPVVPSSRCPVKTTMGVPASPRAAISLADVPPSPIASAVRMAPGKSNSAGAAASARTAAVATAAGLPKARSGPDRRRSMARRASSIATGIPELCR